MRPVKILLLVLLCALPAHAQWSVTFHNNTTISSGGSITISTPPHAGDSIFIATGAATSPGTISTISPVGGTCVVAFSKTVGQTFTGGFDSEIWAAGNCSAAITSITLTWSGGGTMFVAAYVVSGMLATPVVDGTGTDSGASSGTSKAGPSVTTTAVGDFVVTTFDPAHSVTAASAGWTLELSTTNGFAFLTSNSSVPGANQTTWTINLTGAYAAVTAAFKPSPIPPAGAVQECKAVNGGVATQNYVVTIAGSGGTAGCTSNFTPGNMLAIAYSVYGSDITAGAASTTGATITWHKAVSVQDSTFTAFWSGILYACPSDITVPTSSIQVTVNMGALVKNTSAIFVQEIDGIQNTNCYDAITGSGNGGTCPTVTNGLATGLSGTLATNPEFIFVSGSGFDSTGCTSAVTVSYSGGISAGSVFGNFTIPGQGQDNESHCLLGGSTDVGACSSFTEFVVVNVTTSATSAATASSGLVASVIAQAGFKGIPATSGRGPKGKIL